MKTLGVLLIEQGRTSGGTACRGLNAGIHVPHRYGPVIRWRFTRPLPPSRLRADQLSDHAERATGRTWAPTAPGGHKKMWKFSRDLGRRRRIAVRRMTAPSA